MIDEKNLFHQPIKNNTKAYDNIRKITTGQGDDCTTGCLLDFNYVNKNCKMIAIDLSKQKAIIADLKAIKQISFTENLSGNMTQYNTLNVKLSNMQLHKSKLGIKNGTEVTLNISSNVVGDSNDENNFPQKLLLTDTQVSKLCKDFENDSPASIKLSKTQ